MSLSSDLVRAARLSALPGVTIAAACDRFGVSRTALQRARKQLGVAALRPTPRDLVVAILTDYASVSTGTLPPDLGTIASYIDYVERSGCTATEVRGLIDELARDGVLMITGTSWRLVEPWPAGCE